MLRVTFFEYVPHLFTSQASKADVQRAEGNVRDIYSPSRPSNALYIRD